LYELDGIMINLENDDFYTYNLYICKYALKRQNVITCVIYSLWAL